MEILAQQAKELARDAEQEPQPEPSAPALVEEQPDDAANSARADTAMTAEAERPAEPGASTDTARTDPLT